MCIKLDSAARFIPFVAMLLGITVGQTTVAPCPAETCYLDESSIDPYLTYTTTLPFNQTNTNDCYPVWTSLTDFDCSPDYSLNTKGLSSYCDPSRDYNWDKDIYALKCFAPCLVSSELPSNVSFNGASGQQNSSEVFLHGDLVTYYCVEGTIVPFTTTYCNNGNWDRSEVPSCKADCDLPDHSTIVSDDNSPVSHGNTVDLICLPGYQSDGNPQVTTSCENGQFNQGFSCTLITTENPTTSKVSIITTAGPVITTDTTSTDVSTTLVISSTEYLTTQTEISSMPTISSTDSPSAPTGHTEVTIVDTTEVVPSIISTEVSSGSTSSSTDSPSTQTEPTEVTVVDTTEVVPSIISTEVSSGSTSLSTDSPSTQTEPTEVPTTAVDTTSVKTDIKSTVFSTTPITPDGSTFRKTTLHDATTTVITTSKITTTPTESTAIATTTDRDDSICDAPDVESALTFEPKKKQYNNGDVIEYSCNDGKRLVGNPSAVCTDGNFYPSDPLLCLDATCTNEDCEAAIGGYCSEEGDCICKPGFTLKNGSCLETESVKVTINLEATFKEVYENQSSSEFLELQADICIAFEISFETIGDGDSFVSCFVLSFKPGSIIADVATVITSSSELTADEIAGNMTEQADGNDAGFTLTGMQYNFTVGSSVVASDLNSCDEELHHCDEHYGTCINAGKGSYTCTCAFGSYQDSNIHVEGTACKIDTISTAVIIGASIAGGVGLAFIIVLLIWLIAYNNTKNTSAIGTKQYQPEVTFSEGKDNRRSMMEQFEDEDDIEQRMQQNAKVISNMTHFNPIPKTNSKYGTPPNVELSSLNTNGYPNQYNGGHSIGV